jgi:hypothetical protein
VDFSRVHHDTHPQLPLPSAGLRQAGVVVGEEPAEHGHHAVQQQRFGRLVDRMNERQDAVTPVDERVVVAAVDARLAQCRLEQLVRLVPELALDGVRAAGGTLDVQGHDGPVVRQAGRGERAHHRRA